MGRKNKLIKQPIKEDFIKFISNRLSESGFKMEVNEQLWIRETQVSSGGGMMVVNGQRRQFAGEVHTIKQFVEIFGEGDLSGIPFIEVNFDIEDNGSREYDIPTVCMFFDDNSLFNYMLNKLFGV